jgi:CDP-diacylglycerol pyrophosphatase
MQAANPVAGHAALLDIPAHTVVLDVQTPYSSSDDILTAAVKQQVRTRLTAQEFEASRAWVGHQAWPGTLIGHRYKFKDVMHW